MTGLASRQAAFIGQVLDHDAALPASWRARQAAGMEVYRNAYRARTMAALADSFERTRRWVGEDAFRAASMHHIIANPPASWTLDDVGRDFDATLAELFADNPEVDELGWLEWAMHRAHIAGDASPLDAAGFSTATTDFAEDDWAAMSLAFVPALTLRKISYDLAAIWTATADDGVRPIDFALDRPKYCIVWREGFRSTFVLAERLEGMALCQMVQGATFAQLCATLDDRMGTEEGIAAAGAMLCGWLDHGIIVRVTV